MRPGEQGGFGPRGGGGGGRGGMRGGDATLNPLVGLDDASKPLRSKLLAVPTLRAKYLRCTREIATKWLDWNTLGPLVTRYQALIAADVKTDTHKLDSAEAFEAGTQDLKKLPNSDAHCSWRTTTVNRGRRLERCASEGHRLTK